MTSPKPDIGFPVSKLSQFSHDPYVRQRVALDRVMRYFYSTLKLSLVFNNSEEINLIGYTNAAYADSSNNQKSTYKMAMLLGNLVCI